MSTHESLFSVRSVRLARVRFRVPVRVQYALTLLALLAFGSVGVLFIGRILSGSPALQNCLKLSFAGVFFLAFLRGLGKWGLLLFAFACALFGSISFVEWTGQGVYTPLVILLGAAGVAFLWVGDKLIAGVLWLAERIMLFVGNLVAKMRGAK